jgi:2-oxo-3-hexenedioate decarboxylase
MPLEPAVVEDLAQHLDTAERNAVAITKITDDYPDMDWQDAYAIQDALRARKEAAGVKIAGLKMGLTSYAKMKQMGVEDPVYGFLTDYGSVEDGGDIACDRLIHPKVEAEVAFMLKTDLVGPGIRMEDVLAATDYVVPAVEIIDSRYENFRFDLKSVVADNTSAARFVTGRTTLPVDGLDLATMQVDILKNGDVVASGTGDAVLGNPAESVAMLANLLGARGIPLRAGTFVMAGAVTEAIAVAPGDRIEARYTHLGSVSMRFTD